MGVMDKIGDFMKTFSPTDVYTETTRRFRNVVGFYSVKENVGATTLVVNVAYLLAKTGKSVLIIDLHINHPGCFRYVMPTFGDEDMKDKIKTLGDKLINSTVPLKEYSQICELKGVYLLSPAPNELVNKYCNMNIDYCNRVMEEAAATYDYVLIDMDEDMRYETTTAAIEAADRIFTIVTPQPEMAEMVGKNNFTIFSAGMGDKFKYVIQNLVRDSSITNILKETELEPIMLIPYADAVRRAGDNYEFFVAATSLEDVASIKYVECVKQIATNITQMGGD